MNFKDQPMKPEEHQLIFWCSRCNQNVPLEEWMTMNCCIKKQRHYGFLRDEETKLPIHAETIEPNQRELDVYGVPNEETLAAMKEADEIARNHHICFSSAEKLSILENDILKAFLVHWGDDNGVVYLTREEAMRHCKDWQLVSEIELKICSGPPAF